MNAFTLAHAYVEVEILYLLYGSFFPSFATTINFSTLHCPQPLPTTNCPQLLPPVMAALKTNPLFQPFLLEVPISTHSSPPMTQKRVTFNRFSLKKQK